MRVSENTSSTTRRPPKARLRLPSQNPLASWVRDQELATTGAHRRNSALSPEQRLILCKRIDTGQRVKHVAAEVGLSRHALMKWHKRWREQGKAGFLDTRTVGMMGFGGGRSPCACRASRGVPWQGY
jgi:hypothetical protein